MNVLRLSSVVLLLAACNSTKEIDDPAMEATGASVGSSTIAVATLPSDADESTIQGAVSPISNNLYALVGQHNAYAATNEVPSAGDALARQDGTGTVSWDGTHLVIDTSWSSGDGIEYVYEVDLTFAEAGEGFSIDGTYDLLFSADYLGFTYDYDISARYDALTSDAAGCPISGGFTVDYKLRSSIDIVGLPTGNGNQSGRVRVEFDGCGNVTVYGSN